MKNRVSAKSRAVYAWVVTRTNTEALKEDFRKAGLVLVGAGYIGLIVGGDKIASFEGLILLVTGLVAWFLGLVKGG